MQNPKVIVSRPETKVKLLKSQRTVLELNNQVSKIQSAIQNETNSFVALMNDEAAFLNVDKERYEFSLELLDFVPKGKKKSK